MAEGLAFKAQTPPEVVEHACNPCPEEVGARGAGVQNQPQLSRDLEANGLYETLFENTRACAHAGALA